MRRHRWLASAVAVLTAIAGVGLVAPALAQNPVKIGVLTPLSPPGDAAAGQFIVRGAKMAADDVNARGGVLGGRKIELVVEDDSGTPEKGVAGFRKLASQDRAVAVIGQFHSSVMGAVQDLAEQFKIPVFSTQASAKGITERHLAYTFRTHVIDPDRVTIWNRWIKQQGFKRVAVLAENTDYGVGVVEDTKKLFKTMDVAAELKTVMFDRAVVDLTPQLLEIKSWKPDLLINVGVGTPVYLILKQASDVALFPATPMLVSYDLPARPEFWKNLGEKGTYVTFITYYHPTMKLTPRGEAFRTKYREQFKEDPVYGALNGYAQITLLADALNAARSEAGESLVKALLASKFEGWNGTISFTRGEGPYWQQWTPPMLFMQYTRPEQVFTEAKIIFPPELKTGDLLMAPKK
ncbi:MAG: ABC transporter substrate-binding protein [Candidatus Rokubacteria bacterium]|nr:ABC transporter substrate-binding protein [Candidatus Rokubacteria bacterium]MBI3827344.1 ABC transporter substrate-binding protein [Candidatus Rokubacteria bacterium]